LPKFNVLLETFMGFFSELCEKLEVIWNAKYWFS